MENRKLVLKRIRDYIKDNKHDPLYFEGFKGTLNISLPLGSQVQTVLQLMDEYPSYNVKTDKYETRSGANRSSLDIWRHIIHYNPKVKLYEVMRELAKQSCCTLFCFDIQRRVFFTDCTYWADKEHLDEYKLTWNDWLEL